MSTSRILESLAEISREMTLVAVVWHAVVLVVLVALWQGWRPSHIAAGRLLATSLASVAVIAVAYRNPVNGVVFAAAALVLERVSRTLSPKPVGLATLPLAALGLALIAFAWCYPHFVAGSPARLLYAAPLGLIPCPTLALVAGFTLLGGGLRSARWSASLAAVTALYGLLGVFLLGVWIDVALLVAALALGAVASGSLTLAAPRDGSR
jgi:hypothetical protein